MLHFIHICTDLVIFKQFVTLLVEYGGDLVNEKCLQQPTVQSKVCSSMLWVTPGCYILSYKIQLVSIF